jgi:hypothetical protein
MVLSSTQIVLIAGLIILTIAFFMFNSQSLTSASASASAPTPAPVLQRTPIVGIGKDNMRVESNSNLDTITPNYLKTYDWDKINWTELEKLYIQNPMIGPGGQIMPFNIFKESIDVMKKLYDEQPWRDDKGNIIPFYPFVSISSR